VGSLSMVLSCRVPFACKPYVANSCPDMSIDCSGVKVSGDRGHWGWPHGERHHSIAIAGIQVSGAHPQNADEEVLEGALPQYEVQHPAGWDTVF
jgi:hypothetical protein